MTHMSLHHWDSAPVPTDESPGYQSRWVCAYCHPPVGVCMFNEQYISVCMCMRVCVHEGVCTWGVCTWGVCMCMRVCAWRCVHMGCMHMGCMHVHEGVCTWNVCTCMRVYAHGMCAHGVCAHGVCAHGVCAYAWGRVCMRVCAYEGVCTQSRNKANTER